MPEGDAAPRGRYKNKAVFSAAIARGLAVDKAARAIGMSRSAVYRWRDSDAEFAAMWRDALESRTEQVEAVLFNMALSGFWPAVVFYLRHLKPETFDRRSRIALGGDDVPLRIEGDPKVMIYPRVNSRTEDTE